MLLRTRDVRLGMLTALLLSSACGTDGAEAHGATAAEAQMGSTDAATVPASPRTPAATVPGAPSEPASPRTPSTEVGRTPAVRSVGASNTPIDYDDPDIKCYKLTAFATPADKTAKYSVPTTPDLYTSFLIKAPWEGTQYLKSIHSVIDNKAIIHHWMLIRQHKDGPERVSPNATGIHNDGDMLYAWAPGTNDLWFGDDVGMEIPSGSLLMLENHYNNTTGGAAPDASGAEVCVTPRKPAHLAGLSYVGTDFINGTSAKGSCTHDSKDPVHLIMSFPHMHKKGVHMKVDLTSASGKASVLHDEPFDFNYQRTYVYDEVVLAPGDKLTTTCTFGSPSRFGTGTEQEMCFFFAIHWPAGALAKKNFFQSLHGPNTCMD